MAFAALALWSGGCGLSASSAPWGDAAGASLLWMREVATTGMEDWRLWRLVFGPASAKLADADSAWHGASPRPSGHFSSAQDLASRGGLRLCGSQSFQAMVLLRIQRGWSLFFSLRRRRRRVVCSGDCVVELDLLFFRILRGCTRIYCMSPCNVFLNII